MNRSYSGGKTCKCILCFLCKYKQLVLNHSMTKMLRLVSKKDKPKGVTVHRQRLQCEYGAWLVHMKCENQSKYISLLAGNALLII